MAYKQVRTPNVSIAGQRGWCLKYVDDSVNAPNRTAYAQIAWDRAEGKHENQDFPENVFIPIFAALDSGAYKGMGHVGILKKVGGDITIWDSESASGHRGVYKSILEWTRWCGGRYLGWTETCDGARFVEGTPDQDKVPAPAPSEAMWQNGTFKANYDMKIRWEPSLSGKESGVIMRKGETRVYDCFVDSENIRWVSYMGTSGNRCYVARRYLDNSQIFGDCY